jgi:hypothetical protein
MLWLLVDVARSCARYQRVDGLLKGNGGNCRTTGLEERCRAALKGHADPDLDKSLRHPVVCGGKSLLLWLWLVCELQGCRVGYLNGHQVEKESWQQQEKGR